MNTQHTHTAGPWKVMADPAYRKGLHPLHHCRFITTADMGATPADQDGEGDFDGEGTIICALRDQPRQAEDAALIAAAPSMLQVLDLIYSNAAESAEWIRERIIPIIARARGEA